MRVIYLVCLIIFCMPELSVQKPYVVNDCSNHTYAIKSMENECVWMKCREDRTYFVRKCRIQKTECPNDGFLQITPGPVDVAYPDCCPTAQCIW